MILAWLASYVVKTHWADKKTSKKKPAQLCGLTLTPFWGPH